MTTGNEGEDDDYRNASPGKDLMGTRQAPAQADGEYSQGASVSLVVSFVTRRVC